MAERASSPAAGRDWDAREEGKRERRRRGT